MQSPKSIGSYRIERLLGVGSFATVWLGRDPELDAWVAIKVLAENWSHDVRVRERFLDEARLLWRLDHERLVRVHAMGELADGRPYLVMAWAQGGSLRDCLAAGPLEVAPALTVLLEIAAGAAILHDNRIVHRDLTPGNILFRRSPRDVDDSGSGAGQVLIADLGLAKALAAASGLTARAGTPGFMAPEQDDPLAVVDVRTDVFALGRLGELLLGTAGARGVTAMPVLRPGVPAGLADVLRRATAYRAEDRYPDAAAFGAAVRRAAGIPPRPYASRSVRARRPFAAVGLLAAILVAAAASGPGAVAAGPRVASDASGRIEVSLPDGWQVNGSGWFQPGADGVRTPGLVMAPAPTRWSTDPAMPGAFVGLASSAGRTSAQFVAGHHHDQCVVVPVRVSRQRGLDWSVAAFTACTVGRPVIVEAAATRPAGQGVVWAQISPPPDAASDFVDTLLAGVRLTA